jgi:hypothetical protein
VVVRVVGGLIGVGLGEALSTRLTVDVIIGTTVGGEVGGLVHEGTALRVGASGADLPEDGAEVHSTEGVGVHVGVGTRHGARAIELVRVEVVRRDLLVVRGDGGVASSGVGAEPLHEGRQCVTYKQFDVTHGGVASSSRGVRVGIAVRSRGVAVSSICSRGQNGLTCGGAAVVSSTLLGRARTSNGKLARNVGRVCVVEVGIDGHDVLGLIHEVEECAGLDRVATFSRCGEVVSLGN